jgi:hypothetical protein
MPKRLGKSRESRYWFVSMAVVSGNDGQNAVNKKTVKSDKGIAPGTSPVQSGLPPV